MMKIEWRPREQPLPVAAVWVRGEAAVALAQKLLEPTRPKVCAVAGEGQLVVVGDDIPWVEGAVWLGESEVPGLFLPTLLTVNVPEALFAQVLLSKGFSLPLAVCLGEVVPLSMMAVVHGEELQKWL